MNQAEFRQWVSHQTVYKPGFEKWLGDDMRRFDAWFQALRPFPLEVAKTASVAVSYDVQASRLFMGDQLAEIRSRCKSSLAAESMVPTERLIVCRRCSNGGLVSVLPQPRVHWATSVGDTSKPDTLRRGVRPKAFGAACSCDAGQRYRYELSNGQRAFPDFDEGTMVDERELRSGPAKSEEIIAECEERGMVKAVATYRYLLTHGRLPVSMVDPGELAALPDYVDAF